MSRSQSFFGARGPSLTAVATTAKAARLGWTGAVAAFACPFILSVPAATASVVNVQDNASQCDSVMSPVASKSEAILGGEMSALEAVQANQRGDAKSACRGAAVVSSEPVVVVSSGTAIASIHTDDDFENVAEAFAITANPTSLARALANLNGRQFRERSEPIAGIAFAEFMIPVKTEHNVPQKITPDRPNTAFASATTSDEKSAPAPTTFRMSRAEPPVKSPFNGKPDIFGSVALRVSHTPLDRQWNGAKDGREAAMAGAALVRAGATKGADHKEHNIHAVNRWVNANIRYVEDRKLYGRADHWASAATTLKSGRGDCEDFAIVKMQLLQASGVKASDMFLVIAKDLVRRTDHSLLVIRVGNEMLVLDNETDLILNADDVRDYRPIMSYSTNGKWLHGYPVKPSGTQMASLAVGR